MSFTTSKLVFEDTTTIQPKTSCFQNVDINKRLNYIRLNYSKTNFLASLLLTIRAAARIPGPDYETDGGAPYSS